MFPSDPIEEVKHYRHSRQQVYRTDCAICWTWSSGEVRNVLRYVKSVWGLGTHGEISYQLAHDMIQQNVGLPEPRRLLHPWS